MKNHIPTYDRDSVQFALFATNMSRLQPKVPIDRYRDYFNRLLGSIQKSGDDQLNYNIKAENALCDFDPKAIERMQERPGIIATFHYGSYRLLSRILCQQDINISLLLSPSIVQEQGTQLLRQHHKEGLKGRLELLDASSPTVLLGIAKALKKGNHVVVYMDGNEGARGITDSRGVLQVDFLENKMYVRKGLLTIAHRLQIPVYPVLSESVRDRVQLLSYEPIIHEDREQLLYEQYALDNLYEMLAKSVTAKPYYWEGMMYALPFVPLIDLSVGIKSEYSNNIWPFIYLEKHYCMDVDTYSFREINQEMYQRYRNNLRSILL